jgi:hypothetical protein
VIVVGVGGRHPAQRLAQAVAVVVVGVGGRVGVRRAARLRGELVGAVVAERGRAAVAVVALGDVARRVVGVLIPFQRRPQTRLVPHVGLAVGAVVAQGRHAAVARRLLGQAVRAVVSQRRRLAVGVGRGAEPMRHVRVSIFCRSVLLFSVVFLAEWGGQVGCRQHILG